MPFKDKLKLRSSQKKYRERIETENHQCRLDLFNIRKGNVCSLCEKQLHWLYRPDWQADKADAIALSNHRAICRECFEMLENTKRLSEIQLGKEVKHE
jgi:hypothetical protein